MNIVGLDGVVYGVEELNRCIEFRDDFGLNQTEANDDPALPPSPEEGSTVREVFGGVDSPQILDAIADELGFRQSDSYPDLGHEGEEAFFVVQGRVRVNIGDESHVLEVGDSVHWAAALPHQTINIGEEKAKLIFARTPPGFRDLRFIENEIGAP